MSALAQGTYRAVEIPRNGGPDVFRLIEKPRVGLKPEEVRIGVRAAGVNFADLMMRMGAYPEAPPLPFVPGYEVAGQVIETGSEAHRLKVGDRVFAGTRFGGYAAEVVLPESQVWKTPSRLSDVEAAAILVNFLTARIALHEMARVRTGDRVLVHSAAGGVGVAAVQIAARAGATVSGLTGSPSKLEAIRGLGAAEALLNADWERDCGHMGYDIILDAVGGRSLKRSFERLAPAGRVVSFGVSSMIAGSRRSPFRAVALLARTPFFHPLKLMMQNKGVFGLNLLQFFDSKSVDLMSRNLQEVLREIESGAFTIHIGKTFPLAEAGAAHRYLQSRSNVGKVILEV